MLSEKANGADTVGTAPNDATLAQRVASQVFRDGTIPKGKINLNAENGVVVVRGVIERPEQIDVVTEAIRNVSGVQHVQNLLHVVQS
jgi:osmotically-inducible protein OsmY